MHRVILKYWKILLLNIISTLKRQDLKMNEEYFESGTTFHFFVIFIHCTKNGQFFLTPIRTVHMYSTIFMRHVYIYNQFVCQSFDNSLNGDLLVISSS